MKVRFLLIFRIFPWLIISLIAAYLYFGNGAQDLFTGIQYRHADDFFRSTRAGYWEVTEIQVFLLAGSPEQKTDDQFVAAKAYPWPVFGTIHLTGRAELEAFMNLWGAQMASPGEGGDCHDPAYGFRFFRGSELMAETTVCWHCHNFFLPGTKPIGGGFYGFQAEGEKARQLLEFCDQRLPYFRPSEKVKK